MQSSNDELFNIINTIDYENIDKLSIRQIYDYLKELGEINWFAFDGSDRINNYYIIDLKDDVWSLCSAAAELIVSDFRNELVENEQNDYRVLLAVIRSGIAYCTNILMYDSIKTDYEQKNKEWDAQKIEINKTIATSNDELEKKADELEDKIEKNAYTRLFSLMGVFTTIITIILSLVATTSTWLNNANGCQAIIAFTIPSAVIVTSLMILLGIVMPKNMEAAKGKLVATIVLSAFLVITVVYAFWNEFNTHTQFIITPDCYEIVKTSNSQKEVIKFEINGSTITNTYNKGLIHEHNNIHYCIKHEELE